MGWRNGGLMMAVYDGPPLIMVNSGKSTTGGLILIKVDEWWFNG